MTTFTKNQRIKTLVVTKGADHNDVEHTLQPGAVGFIDSVETFPAPQGVSYIVVIETGNDDETHIVNVFDETDGDITTLITATDSFICNGATFQTFKEASAHAGKVFKTTGIIVAVERG